MRQNASVPLLILADFVAAFVFVWVFHRVRTSFPPTGAGGAAFGFLCRGSGDLPDVDYLLSSPGGVHLRPRVGTHAHGRGVERVGGRGHRHLGQPLAHRPGSRPQLMRDALGVSQPFGERSSRGDP
jgi:hypothetical protein